MSYKVMLVDDEMIILSGIRHIIDWEKYDSRIISTAKNGSEALERIKEEKPDIIITDMRMPRMDGIELMRICSENYPEIVFIVLTNLEDFKTVHDSIKYNAIDYLLKSELDERSIAKSLERAINECKKRNAIARDEQTEMLEKKSKENAISSLFILRDLSDRNFNKLISNNIFSCYAIIGILLDIENDDSDDIDIKALLSWENELCEKIIPSFFSEFYTLKPIECKNNMVSFFLTGFDERSYHRCFSTLKEKIQNASLSVMNLNTDVISTKPYKGRTQLFDCRASFEAMCTMYYLEKMDLEIVDLDIEGKCLAFEKLIQKKDKNSIEMTFNLIEKAIKEKDHAPSEALLSIDEILSSMKAGVANFPFEAEANEAIRYYRNKANQIIHRKDTINLLDGLKNEFNALLAPESGNHNPIIVRAKMYISDNIMKPMTLSDIANASFVSPAYLSALFKKQTGIALVEYINQSKIEKAKELMENGKKRVDEIALSLGFENIYYFSKVFKKVTGTSPSEYMKRI